MPDFEDMSQDEIDKYVEEQKEEHAEALEEKKDELLEEVKTERKKRQDLEKRLDKLEEEKKEAEKDKARKEENIEELEKRLEEEKQEEIQQRESRIEKLRQELHEEKVEQRLTDTLLEHNVSGDYLEYVRNHLRNNVKLVETDEGFQAVAEQDGREMPIDDFVGEWAEQEGEKFIQAPDHRGGGAGSTNGGPSGGGGSNNPLDKTSDNYSVDKAAQYVQEHGEDSDEVQQKLDQASDPVRIEGVNA